MRDKVHMRVAYDKRRRKATFAVNARPTSAPLTNGRGHPLPTVAFALMIGIPDEAFERASEVIAELRIPNPEIAAEVKAET